MDKLYQTIYKAYRKAGGNVPTVMVATLTIGKKDHIGELLSYLK